MGTAQTKTKISKAKAGQLADDLWKVRPQQKALEAIETALADQLKTLPNGEYVGAKARATVYENAKTAIDPETLKKEVDSKTFMACISVKVGAVKEAIGEIRVKKIGTVTRYPAVRTDLIG